MVVSGSRFAGGWIGTNLPGLEKEGGGEAEEEVEWRARMSTLPLCYPSFSCSGLGRQTGVLQGKEKAVFGT